MPAYTVIYSGAGSTTNKKRRAAVSITVGNKTTIAVPFPSVGFLHRLTIVQTGGTAVDFVADLFNSKIPFPAGTVAVATAAADEVELYRIIPQISATAGNVAQYSNEQGHPYLNIDGSFTVNERVVYLQINPTSAVDTTTWDIAISCHDNHGA